MICPNCGNTLKETLQFSDPCFVGFLCERCHYHSSFECIIYNMTEHDVTQDVVQKAYNHNYDLLCYAGMIEHVGTHETHCCSKHGCKYGDENCPVVNGQIKQKYQCEECYNVLQGEGRYTHEDMQKAFEYGRYTAIFKIIEHTPEIKNDITNTFTFDNWIKKNYTGDVSE